MLKQYVFIPKSLKMSVGKAASQVAHATFMALEKQSEKTIHAWFDRYEIGKNQIEIWKDSGMCVIVLEAKNPEHLMQISKYFEQWNITHHLYIDEGYTEVLPMTATALATEILDDEDELIKGMLKNFKLYGARK